MGEKLETEQRSPNTGKRPSPTSVKELLDIVHLQQASVPLSMAVKQDADVLSARGGFNPLPAIGKSTGSSPPVRDTPPQLAPQTTARGESTIRTRANSDGSQYAGNTASKSHVRTPSLENGNAPMPSIHLPRDGAHHPVPAGRPTQQRRERMLPPLSETKSLERPQSRQGNLDVASKSPLRRTSSGDAPVRVPSVNSNQGNGERMQRPKSSRGRRRPTPSEIIAIHNSVPAPYEDEDVFTLEDASPRRGNCIKRTGSKNSNSFSQQNQPSRQRSERPKSSKGRSRPRISTTDSLSQGDDWSSEEDLRPRAPSPPSPGLDSDLDSGNEDYDGRNGRNVRPR